jgi:hypothetical protein
LNRKEYFKKIDDERQQEFIRMQRELFNQAKSGASQAFFQEHDDMYHDHDDHPLHHTHHDQYQQFEENEESKLMQEGFLSYLTGEEGEDRSLSE